MKHSEGTTNMSLAFCQKVYGLYTQELQSQDVQQMIMSEKNYMIIHW